VTGINAPPAEVRDLRIDLVLPVTRFGVGPFSFDPIERWAGVPIRELLSSLLRDEVRRRTAPSGVGVEVYPLRLPDGEGASISLGQFGELAFANDGGLLVLVVPLRAEGWIRERFGRAIVNGPERGPSSTGLGTVSRFWIRLETGMCWSIPLGGLGEVGVEAGG